MPHFCYSPRRCGQSNSPRFRRARHGMPRASIAHVRPAPQKKNGAEEISSFLTAYGPFFSQGIESSRNIHLTGSLRAVALRRQRIFEKVYSEPVLALGRRQATACKPRRYSDFVIHPVQALTHRRRSHVGLKEFKRLFTLAPFSKGS